MDKCSYIQYMPQALKEMNKPVFVKGNTVLSSGTHLSSPGAYMYMYCMYILSLSPHSYTQLFIHCQTLVAQSQAIHNMHLTNTVC